MHRLVNEQTLVSLLLAGPGVIATILFAPLIIALFYSAEFSEAVEVLRWICLGVAMRVITWPIGFIIVAKNRQVAFISTEVAWALVNVGLTWLCVTALGLSGAGIAFFGSYVFHGFMIYPIANRLSGFRLTGTNTRMGLFFATSIALIFCGVHFLPPLSAYLSGTLLLLLIGAYSLRSLFRLVSADSIPKPFLRFVAK